MARLVFVTFMIIVMLVGFTFTGHGATSPSDEPGLAEVLPWIENAVMYGVVPRNFGPDGFKSVTARLDDLADLGVNVLWLSPVNVTLPREYGYAVVDYYNLRSDYGTEDDFRELIQEAHRRGMKVIMDMVPNHTSASHPYYLDALQNGPDSPYYDFYQRDHFGRPRYYFGWSHLPNLNYDNPQVREWMIDVLTYWIREFDIDGYRIDVAWGLRQRRPDFWPQVREAITAIKPEVLLIAEASARDPYYFDHGYDAAYDWTGELGKWAWENVFQGFRGSITERLHAALTNEGRGYHPNARIVRFLNNNDTGKRFISRYGYHMLKVSAAMLLTLPGIPTLFTGDEVAATFDPYVNAGPINWGDWLKMRPYYKRLIHLRRTTPSLYSLDWRRIDVKPEDTVYAYLRYTEYGDPPALVLLNFADSDVSASFTLPEELHGHDVLYDRLTGQALVVDHTQDHGMTLTLERGQAMILMTYDD